MVVFRRGVLDLRLEIGIKDVMPGLQEQHRNQIIQFVERWKHHHADWRMMTAHHFMDQCMPKSTVYEILQRIEHTGSVACKIGSGRKALKIYCQKREALRRAVNHKTGVSQRHLVIRFGCDQSYISQGLLKDSISCAVSV